MAKGQVKQKKTPTVIKALEEALGLGCSIVNACLQAGISESTYHRWCEEDEKLKKRFAMLRQKQILKARKIIDKALNENDVNTAKWYLERKCKDEFSPTVKQEIEQSVTVTKIKKVVIDPRTDKPNDDA